MQVKVIIFVAGKEDQFWLHINKIRRIYTRPISHSIETTIYLEDEYKIRIEDPYKQTDFKTLIHDFINSEDKVEHIKVTDFQYSKKWCFMRTTDWVEQVVTKKKIEK